MSSQGSKNASSSLLLVFPADNSYQTIKSSRAINQPWLWRMTIKYLCCALFA